MRKTKTMQHIEKQYNQDIRQVLINLYDQHGTREAVAQELGIDPSTLTGWLPRLNLIQHTTLRHFHQEPSQ